MRIIDDFAKVVNLSRKNIDSGLNFLGIESLTDQIIKQKDYNVVVEGERLNSCFIYLVPKNLTHELIQKMKKTKDQVLSFSIFIGKKNGREARIGAYGIECDKLGRALIEHQNRSF